MNRLACLAVVLLGCARAPDPAPASSSAPAASAAPSAVLIAAAPLRLVDVARSIGQHLDKPVDVVIVEPLRGPETPAELARASYGQVRVDIRDAGAMDLALVPGSWRAGDPSRYLARFDRVLAPPIRVKGVLLEDVELGRKDHPSYVIRVERFEPAPVDPPTRVSSPDQLAALDRRVVAYEGVYTVGFEVSNLDQQIWLSVSPGLKEVGSSSAVVANGRKRERVRVTGVLFAQPGARYGHLGSGRYEIVATEIEYFGP